MNSKKDIRKNFKESVFKRDGYYCRWCRTKYTESTAEEFLDAHHITDRNEIVSGGYVKENGISLCKNDCHIKAEKFHISKGEDWTIGMHPDDLYILIGSSKDEAIKASEKL